MKRIKTTIAFILITMGVYAYQNGHYLLLAVYAILFSVNNITSDI